jgi:mannose-6-phosphate isomerase-like protein (cupin superfamily)
MKIEHRPWGTYEVLYTGEDCKVKKIIVDPGQRLSYQYHHKRNEYWTVISGNGEVRLNEDIISVNIGSHIFIPAYSRHTISNTSKIDPVVFIEIQTGDYFEEDDIVRLEDDYGRVKT